MPETRPDIVSQMYRSDVLASGYKFVISYAEKLNGDTVEFLHTHLDHEIYYVLENRILCHVDGQVHCLKKGDLLFIAPRVKHYVVYEPEVKKDYFVLIYSVEPNPGPERPGSEHQPQYEEMMRRLDVVRRDNFLIVRGNTEMDEILEKIRREKNDQLLGWDSLLNSYLFHFFIHAARMIEAGEAKQTVEIPRERLNLGVDASKFIHGNYHLDISLDDAAVYLRISPRHVNRVFREVFGTTFSKTLSLLRLNYAKKYLSTTDHSIEKISELVGFRTPRTLFKLFNQYENTTVAEYRKKHKSKGASPFD